MVLLKKFLATGNPLLLLSTQLILSKTFHVKHSKEDLFNFLFKKQTKLLSLVSHETFLVNHVC